MSKRKRRIKTIKDSLSIFTFGNYSGSYGSRLTQYYDFGSNTYKTKSNMPIPRYNADGLEAENSVYILGGYNSNDQYIRNIDRYNPLTDSWSTDGSLLIGRELSSSIYYENCIYTFSGKSSYSSITPRTEVFNLTTKTSSYKSDIQIPRWDVFISVLVDGRAYIFGGRTNTGSPSVYTKKVEMYDIANDSWTFKRDMPTENIPYGGIYYNNKIFLVKYYTIEIYDIQNDSWSTINNSYQLDGFLISRGKVYNNELYFVLREKIVKYNPQNNIWMTVANVYNPNSSFVVGGFIKMKPVKLKTCLNNNFEMSAHLLNPIAHYKFEENINDCIGSHHGNSFNINFSKSFNNFCADFNGFSSYFSLDNLNYLFRNNTPFAMMFFIRTISSTSNNIFASNLGSGFNTYLIHMNQGIITLHRYVNYSVVLSTQNKYNDGKWHLVIVQYTGNSIALKVDDEYISIQDERQTSCEFIRFGTDSFLNSYYTGSIDELLFFNRALSLEELNSLFRNFEKDNITFQHCNLKLLNFCRSIYNSSRDFSNVQGNKNWYYQKNNNDVYNNLSWISYQNRWHYMIALGQFNDGEIIMHPNGSTPTTLSWKSPFSGVAKVYCKSNVRKADTSGGDGVRVIFKHNDRVLWQHDLTFNDGVGVQFPEQVLNLNKDDFLRFEVSSKTNDANDSTIFTPIIEFEELKWI